MSSGKAFVLLSVFVLLISITFGQKWTNAGLGNPLESAGARPGPGRRWKIDWTLSDSFFYADKSHPNFVQKWTHTNPTGWQGPGATLFRPGNVFLSAGKLVILASRVPFASQGDPYCTPASESSSGCNCDTCFKTRRTVQTGYLSSRKLLRYPSFIECSMKTSRTPLSSSFWVKANDTEIDMNESYGDSGNRRVSKTNVHIFHRHGSQPPSLNRQENSVTNHDLTKDFHRYGMHWINQTYVEFYFDGRRTRSIELRRAGIRDPTRGYLNEGMRVVLSMAAHAWRKEEGVPTGEQLRDASVNRMIVDWVRTYRAVSV